MPKCRECNGLGVVPQYAPYGDTYVVVGYEPCGCRLSDEVEQLMWDRDLSYTEALEVLDE